MSTLSHIARGWKEFLKGDEYTKHLMSERLAICDGCIHKQQLGKAGKILVKMVNEQASLYKCAKCNCPLSPKTANPTGECPIGKWGIAGV